MTLRTSKFAAIACAVAFSAQASQSMHAQEVEYKDGYQITRRVTHRQVPVTEMREQQQTYYRQQLTTQNLQAQQLYSVPVTQYKMVSKLHGRWNPLVTPYWTHEMKPETTWTQQVGTVQVPVTSTAWVPETRTVRTPVTVYKTAEEVTETRVAMNAPPTTANRAVASTPTGPSATLAARPSYSPGTTAATTPLGGVKLESDPPRQASGGWRPPAGSGRY